MDQIVESECRTMAALLTHAADELATMRRLKEGADCVIAMLQRGLIDFHREKVILVAAMEKIQELSGAHSFIPSDCLAIVAQLAGNTIDDIRYGRSLFEIGQSSGASHDHS